MFSELHLLVYAEWMSFWPGFQIPVSLNFHDFMFKLFPRFHSLWVQKHCIHCSISFYWLIFMPSTTQDIADSISSFPQSFLRVSTFVLFKLGNSLSLSSSPTHVVDKQGWRSLWGPWLLASSKAAIHRENEAPRHAGPQGLWRACCLFHHLVKWRGCSLPIVGSCFGNWPPSECSLVPSVSLELSVSFQCCARTFYLLHQTPPPQAILLCVPKRQVCGMHKLVSMPSGWFSLDSGIWKGRREEKGEYSFPGSLSSVLRFKHSSTKGSCQEAPFYHLDSSSCFFSFVTGRDLCYALVSSTELAVPCQSLVI